MTLSNRYRTGRPDLDAAVLELIAAAELTEDTDLVFEMVVSALRLGREDVTRGDRKLVNAALKEIRYALGVFAPYRSVRKCSIFGSARTPVGHPAYDAAHDFATHLTARDWMIITGAGPGIMTAGLEGAGAANSFGVNIQLPFEQKPSLVLGADPKLVNFRYFFTRKLTFVKESHAICIAPGGFGTLDEMFETLTLMQTGKSFLVPMVLLDEPGGNYWEHLLRFVREELLADGYISPADLDFVHVTHDPLDAVEHICRFYTTYHSARWVGNRLILRLQHEVGDALLERLTTEFADIIVSGAVVRAEATDSEREDDDLVDLPRLAFRYNRHGYARLRSMIDAINAWDHTPGAADAPPGSPLPTPQG
jgi:uncharacterized protein (TIGR00730 family)